MGLHAMLSTTIATVVLFLLSLTSLTASIAGSPKLGRLGGSRAQRPLTVASSDGFEIRSYTQSLDHFNYGPDSYAKFQQRYAINYDEWGGTNTSSPIFVYTGHEADLMNVMATGGFLKDNAAQFRALLVFIEHRYYGESMPFGSKEETYQNSTTLGYFSSSQALADYAELILDLKKNLSAESCPVIVMGGSYGGSKIDNDNVLALYPHIAIGALASSAPILYFDDITPQDEYYRVVTKDFRETSESCYETIRQSWLDIDQIASQPNGMAHLSQTFNTCRPLTNSQQLKDSLEYVYAESAQYDDPANHPVSVLCNGMNGEPNGTDVLRRIVAGIEALHNRSSCFMVDGGSPPQPVRNSNENSDGGSSSRYLGWYWQVCTEIVIPIGRSSNDTMFQARPFNLTSVNEYCQETYGVTPRPHWITTEFGGHDIKSVLKNFGSNIIFSNGLRDPYSSGGVLQNISDSIVSINTSQGSHCLDISASTPDDPQWLVSQRNEEIEIIKEWIAKYNASILAKTNSGI